MEDLAVITALNHFGSFRKNFINFKDKKDVIHQPKFVCIEKNCALCLKYCLSGGTWNLGHRFS